MATNPPLEMPEPSQPGSPEVPPAEVGPNSPDVDVPSPNSEPSTIPSQPTD